MIKNPHNSSKRCKLYYILKFRCVKEEVKLCKLYYILKFRCVKEEVTGRLDFVKHIKLNIKGFN